jgi:hypothetical protein
LSDAAPTSTGLPEASVNVTINSLSPFFRFPLELASAMVISPDLADLMTFSSPDELELRQAATNEIAIVRMSVMMKALVLIILLRQKGIYFRAILLEAI